ncbi:MAG: hypothetical protein WD895_09595 [Acidimicrobiia bacterium]
MRVLIVAGIPVGVLVAGVGSRLAMLLIRVTSPDRVVGVTSDDGFTIGEVTLGGTYNLLLLGAAVGVIGAGAYQMVAPWLIGPIWFRRLTTGLASAAVVGSMLVHADGIDFTLLKPTWLAIGLIAVGCFSPTVHSVWLDQLAKPVLFQLSYVPIEFISADTVFPLFGPCLVAALRFRGQPIRMHD